jgi:hypothetical protein
LDDLVALQPYLESAPARSSQRPDVWTWAPP